MVTPDPSWKRTQGCIAHHAVMLDLECAGVKVHAAPCSCAETPAIESVFFEPPFSCNYVDSHRAKAMPGRLPVGHFASICGTVIAGLHPDTDRRYTMVEPQMGGWGATATRDGMNAMYSCSHGDTFNCPVEICEARYGLDVVYNDWASEWRLRVALLVDAVYRWLID